MNFEQARRSRLQDPETSAAVQANFGHATDRARFTRNFRNLGPLPRLQQMDRHREVIKEGHVQPGAGRLIANESPAQKEGMPQLRRNLMYIVTESARAVKRRCDLWLCTKGA